MIDFNDVAPQRTKPVHYDLDAIVARLRDTAEHWVPQYFPNGRRNGDEWRLANILGDAPRKQGSCVITLKGDHAGDWIDFDGNGSGGPLSTLEQATGLYGTELFAYAAQETNCSLSTTPPRHDTAKTPPQNRDAKTAREIIFIHSHGQPLKDTPAATYLKNRNLDIPDTPDLLFHADLTHWETKSGYLGMIGIVRDCKEAITGLHRTYLQETDNTVTKADITKSRKMLGKISGGAVRLAGISANGSLGICEGIETGLAVMTACPELPVWAALSTKGMEQIILPPEAHNIVLLADNDASGAGLRAATKTAQRLHSQGRRVWIAIPPRAGDDFNDLLLKEGREAVRVIVHDTPEDIDKMDSEPGKEIAATEANEDAIARAFSARFKNTLRFDHHRGRWFQWDSTRWKLEETKLAFAWCRNECRRAALSLNLPPNDAAKLVRASTAAAVERYAQSDRAHAVISDVWDPDRFTMGTPGGTVDLRTGVLRQAEREDYITRLTAVAPDNLASCEVWLRFLHDATQGDEGLIRFLRQMSGYCLTGDIREHALFFIYGSGGNGKSVFLNTINGILAEYAQTAVMDAFTASAYDKHSTDIAMLRGARMVSVSETEEGRAWAETRIKQLTGGDKVTARFMRQDNFTFAPQFKLVIVGNHKPALHNVDDAAKRRFNIIPFTTKPNKPDRQLEEKLKAEWPAILNWMVEGCLDWQQNGLVRPGVVARATAEYFDDQDIFGQWLDECCVIGAPEFEVASRLFQAWKAFAERQGDRSGSAKAFSANLTKRGFVADQQRINGHKCRLYRGLSLPFDPAASGINHD